MSRFKRITFDQNNPKIKLFLQKNAKLSSPGGSAPDPRASGGWRLCPQITSLRREGASLPVLQWFTADGGSAPRPPKQPPHCEFLATRLLTSANVKTWFEFDLQIKRAERAEQFKNFKWILNLSTFVISNGHKKTIEM